MLYFYSILENLENYLLIICQSNLGRGDVMLSCPCTLTSINITSVFVWDGQEKQPYAYSHIEHYAIEKRQKMGKQSRNKNKNKIQ